MLRLTRKTGQAVRIGDDVTLIVLKASKDRVELGFVSPEGVTIWRDEIPVDDVRGCKE